MGLDDDKGTVCVTGGTGYIASWLIMRLLQHGYTVRTTIRPHPEGKTRDVSFLTNLARASSDKLQIFYSDLNQPESFTAAIDGCTGVFHVAHPVADADSEAEETATKRSVDAALGIIKACLDSKTVKRVVYTSSCAAVFLVDQKGNQEVVLDESSWSDVDFYRSLTLVGLPYVAAKTKTEMAVFEFAHKFGLDVVSLNPSLVVGPFLCPKLPSSVARGLTLIFGNEALYGQLLRSAMVHIDDVVNAHIFLLENPSANGRYICSSEEISLIGMSQYLSAKYPHLKIPTKESLKDVEGYTPCSLSSKKLLDSGFKYKYGLDDMFDGAIQSCKEKGFLNSVI